MRLKLPFLTMKEPKLPSRVSLIVKIESSIFSTGVIKFLLPLILDVRLKMSFSFTHFLGLSLYFQARSNVSLIARLPRLIISRIAIALVIFQVFKKEDLI